MPALNRVQLIGHLGKDPESRYPPSGKQVTTFSIAVSNRWKSKGETKEYTEWVNIEAWGRLGEICQEYLSKGQLVYLEGRLQTDRYEQDGDVKYFTKVITRSMQMLERKAGEDEVVVPPLEDSDSEAE